MKRSLARWIPWALILAALWGPPPAAGQYRQPWLGTGATPAVAPATPVAPVRADAVLRVGLTVSDMERSVAFYTGVLDFERVSDVEVAGEGYERLTGVFGVRLRVVRLRLGDEELELTEYLAPTTGRPAPPDARSNDGWFQHVAVIVSDMGRAYERLRERRVRFASTGPQRLPDWNPNAGGIEAFYFKDPDGHPLEILHFPAGKGDPKWHRPTDRLFLGIDHTAIVVRDTRTSLGFYRDLLGLRVAGQSENHGTEQEHLNNVRGARLRITGLRARSGPGIEFLEYVHPRDGRPYPADARPNDLIHWQTTVRVRDAAGAFTVLTARGARPVSDGPAAVPDSAIGLSRAALVRDPDGHAVQLAEP